MYDLLLSWIRTAVPAGVGGLAAWLGTKGLNVDPQDALTVGATVGAASTTVYQVVISTLQRRWPLFGLMLGSTKLPVYQSGSNQGLHSDRDLRSL